MQRNASFAVIASLFFVIFLDQLGVALVFPILTPLLLSAHGDFLQGILFNYRNIIYGITLSISPICMFFGAPVFGDLSDQIGRKKVLLFCLLGSAASFGLSAISIIGKSLVLLVVSRAIAGFCYGSQSIAQAAIMDVSTPERKAINLSVVVIAGSLGIITGPLIGGYFSDPTILQSFNFATPFEIAIVLALLNALILQLSFSETFVVKQPIKIHFSRGLSLFINAFKDPNIRLLSFVFLFIQFGWGLYFQAISWIMLQSYGFDSVKIGLFTGNLGIWFTIGLTIGVRLFEKYCERITAIIVCLIVMAAASFASFLIPLEIVHWIASSIIACANIITFVLSITLFSNAAGKESQGLVMGITGSVMAFAWFLTALFVGPLGGIAIKLPLLLCGLTFVIAIVLCMNFYRKSR